MAKDTRPSVYGVLTRSDMIDAFDSHSGPLCWDLMVEFVGQWLDELPLVDVEDEEPVSLSDKWREEMT